MSPFSIVLLKTENPDDLHENKIVAILIVIVIFGFAIWKAWPSLMANNVFSKDRPYDYGRSEELLDRKIFIARAGSVITLLLALAGITQLVGDALLPGDTYQTYHAHKIDPQGLFMFSLIGTICVFIYTLLDGTIFAGIHNLKYTLKVWLTAIFTSPLVLVLLDFHRVINSKWFFNLYFNTAILGHGVSIVTLALMIFAVDRFSKKHWKIPKKRLYVFAVTQASLVLNMLIIVLLMRPNGLGWLLQLLPYCITAGLGIWFYPMDKTVYSEVALYTAEEIKD